MYSLFKAVHNCVPFLKGNVYFAIRNKSTAGDILPQGKPDWLNWSCDKDDPFRFAYDSWHMT